MFHRDLPFTVKGRGSVCFPIVHNIPCFSRVSGGSRTRRHDLHRVACQTTTPQTPSIPIPRPGFEPGTPRSKRGMMVPFTIGASSGRQGSRTLISVGRTALAERPGQPYPATFRFFLSVDPPRVELGFPICQTGVFPLDDEPFVVQWTCRGVEPRSPGCKPGVFPLDEQPICSCLINSSRSALG